MKYFFLASIVFFSSYLYAEDNPSVHSNNSENVCTYEQKTYSLGFVLTLSDGNKFLRCTKIINSENTIGVAWVEIQAKKSSENFYKLKE